MTFLPTRNLLLIVFSCKGQVQPVDEPDTRAEVHGSARGGLPLLQTHAGQRTTRHASHGNAACEEKINWVSYFGLIDFFI